MQWARFFVSLLSVGLLVYGSSIGIKNIFRYNVFELESRRLKSQLGREQARNHALILQQQRMQAPQYWEEKIRQELGYVRPNEVVYQVNKTQ
jgi:cell division protein FtsB